MSLDYSRFSSFRNHENIRGDPGKEHYRLLMYFSTLFDNSTIIDIGTHWGDSSLSLSYNESNTVYTFDIIDKVSHGEEGGLKLFSSRENIKRRFTNIWDDLEKNKDFLMSAPLIFIDIDPHEGKDELIFYYFMRIHNYPGILIFDDIHHFEGMRWFWKHVSPEHKRDATRLGHFSGTGIVCFNSDFEIILEKN